MSNATQPIADALTADALHQVDAVLAGARDAESALLRQVIAVAAGRLSRREGAVHVERVFETISGALRGWEGDR